MGHSRALTRPDNDYSHPAWFRCVPSTNLLPDTSQSVYIYPSVFITALCTDEEFLLVGSEWSKLSPLYSCVWIVYWPAGV